MASHGAARILLYKRKIGKHFYRAEHHFALTERIRYNIFSFLSIPEKFAISTRILLVNENVPTPRLAITYLSASSFPFALPQTIARGIGWPKIGFGIEGVNEQVGRWLLSLLDGSPPAPTGKAERDGIREGDNEPRIRGWVLMDFYSEPEDSVVPLLVECNFRGRRAGEEGWV
jgi:1-phosphatidylinositol phosphodiesterase